MSIQPLFQNLRNLVQRLNFCGVLLLLVVHSSGVAHAATHFVIQTDSTFRVQLTPFPTIGTPQTSIALLPTLAFLPETRIIGGLVVQALLRNNEDIGFSTKPSMIQPRGKFSPSIIGDLNAISDESHQESESRRVRPSRVVLNALYTQNKQTILSFEPDLWLHHDSLHLYAFAEYTNFPDKFWGLGAHTPSIQEEQFSGKYYTLQASVEWLLAPSIYAGTRYEFQRTFIEGEQNSMINSGTVPGTAPTTVSGLTLFATYDSRDNLFATEQGSFLQVVVSNFSTFLGSDINFMRASIDARTFMTPYRGGTLALQSIMSVASVGTPFRQMGLLGGQRLLRGIRRGRFVDNTMVVTQAEWRQALFWRIGVVGFAGIGTVAPSLDKIEINDVKITAGLGLRFALFPDDRLNVRFDLGWSKYGSGFYINIAEAF